MLRVRPPERQPVTQPGKTARITAGAGAGYGVEGVGVAVVAVVQHFVFAEGREAVGPDVGEVGGGYAAAVVADADREGGDGGG